MLDWMDQPDCLKAGIRRGDVWRCLEFDIYAALRTNGLIRPRERGTPNNQFTLLRRRGFFRPLVRLRSTGHKRNRYPGSQW
jgi:hypothetical protein